MKVYGYTQYVSTAVRQLKTELDRVEALVVGETASRVHADGYRFLEWPTVTRTWIGYRGMSAAEVELEPGHRNARQVCIRLEVLVEER